MLNSVIYDIVPLNLAKLQPDFLTTNCHKWLYTPRGSAVLYVPTRNQHLIRTTLPTSWGYIPPDISDNIVKDNNGKPKTKFELLFETVATCDDTPYACIPTAIKFRNQVCGGDERIFEYLETLAIEGGDIVASALGTEVMGGGTKRADHDHQHASVSLFRRCAMFNVKLPFVFVPSDQPIEEPFHFYEYDAPYIVKWMGRTLVQKYGTFVPTSWYGGALWTRLSAQIYLDKSDFDWIGGVLKEMCEVVGNRVVNVKE